jgi:hypothetical protein
MQARLATPDCERGRSRFPDFNPNGPVMRAPEQSPLLSPRFVTLAALICFAVATRLVAYFVPNLIPPNFSPVESIALFGGAYFGSRSAAYLVPLAAMLLADLVIGLHDLLLVVYGCIALTVALGFSLRGRVKAVNVALLSCVSALLFFAMTNFFVWLTSGMYPLDGAGLVACYVAAIPFLKFTLAGALFWSAVLFGGYALLRRRFPALQSTTA